MGDVGLVRRGCGRSTGQLFADLQVHLVVHQPQGHLGNLGWEFFNFYAVELVHVHANQAVHVHAALAGVAAEFVAGAQHGQLQQAQFAVGNDQKFPPRRRGQKREVAQLLVKLKQAVAVVLTFSNSAHSASRNRGLMSFKIFSSLV